MIENPFAEICRHCDSQIMPQDAYCTACGMQREVITSTPREDYLRAHIAALELLRQSSRRVHALPETRRAEELIESVIDKVGRGAAL
jgi:hypothetical protein